MAEIITPSWQLLNDLVTSAKDRVLVCSPFYTKAGLTHLFDNFGTAKKFQFWTRMNPSDWAHGAADPVELVTLMDILLDDGREIDLRLSAHLHAKAYVADEKIALIGSSNLSDGGFDTNMEILVQFKNAEAKKAIRNIEDQISPRLREISLVKFKDWVNDNKIAIKKIQDNDPLSDKLKDIQKTLDELLGHGKRKTKKKFDDKDIMNSFVKWLQKNKKLAGAEELLSRYKNASGINLTGHFRQSFYGAFGFFSTYPKLLKGVASDLRNLNSFDIYAPTQSLKDQWIRYLDDNATLSGEQFNYAVLRGILPPAMGGTVIGGGGGIGTLKRMLPLVAQFVLETDNE